MTNGNRTFHGLVLLAFALMVVVVSLSAHMRLSAAGLGCADWPACYGRNLAGLAPPHPGWVNTVHRVAASVMGFVILAIAAFAWHRRRETPADFRLALPLLVLTAFLAALGKWTPDADLPAVALSNLLGGLWMLALLWRLHLGYTPRYAAPSRLRAWVLLGLGLLVMQITLGGMVSANFAASSCASLPACEDNWWPAGASLAAFNPFQVLHVAPGGQFVPGAIQQTLHMAHRFAAVVVFCYFAWLGIGLLKKGWRGSGMLLLAVLTLQIALGMATVAFQVPLFVVLAHNANAALLLLLLTTLAYRLKQR